MIFQSFSIILLFLLLIFTYPSTYFYLFLDTYFSQILLILLLIFTYFYLFAHSFHLNSSNFIYLISYNFIQIYVTTFKFIKHYSDTWILVLTSWIPASKNFSIKTFVFFQKIREINYSTKETQSTLMLMNFTKYTGQSEF